MFIDYNDNEIDCNYTDEIRCPWCGNIEGDSFEYSPNDEDLGLIECCECGKEFYGTRNIEVTYSSEKAKYGTCVDCGKENIVLHNEHAYPAPKYLDLCKECAKKEEKEQWKKYYKEVEANICG